MRNRVLSLLFVLLVWIAVLGLVAYEASKILNGVESELMRIKSLDEINDGNY